METSKSVGQMTENTFKETPNIGDGNMDDSGGLENNDHSEQEGRKCKLSIFPSNHFFNQSAAGTINHDLLQEEPELVLHHDDFPYLNGGDVIEICQPDIDIGADDPLPRLLLMVCFFIIYLLNLFITNY